jgi:uncharacterized protein (TIGR02270 family)
MVLPRVNGGFLVGRMNIASVLSQHAEEAAFQWLLRDSSVCAPHYSMQDLAKLDGMVEAHIDGLRIAGDAGWQICLDELAWEEPGEVFAGGVLAFESGIAERIDRVLQVASESLELARGAVSALGWLAHEQARLHIESLVASNEPILRRIGIAASAIHRQDNQGPEGDREVNAHPWVRARALKAAGEMGRVELIPSCLVRLETDDDDCRFWSAWSAAILGDRGAARSLQAIAESGGPHALRAGDLAARCSGHAEALRWSERLAGDPKQRDLAIRVAGALGDPESVPWLTEQMSIPDLARRAGEAFSMITGVDIAYQDLDGEWPEGFQAGPTENPEDEDVAMDADEDLPWPDPEKIGRWWSQHRADFKPAKRHLLGTPISEDSLQDALRRGQQRQRAAAALELSLLQRGRPLFEVRARGDRQLAALR